MKLNVGSGPYYAEGWVNTDFVRYAGIIEPDVVVDPVNPLPFFPETFSEAYVGHCLEHIPWPDVPKFLGQLAEVMEPEGDVMFVGPDAHRVIDGYRDGTATWHQVAIIIEERSAYTEAGGFAAAPRWDADRHWWNCSQDRVADLLIECRWRSVTCHGVDPDGTLPAYLEEDWPVVSRAPFQFACSARPPL